VNEKRQLEEEKVGRDFRKKKKKKKKKKRKGEGGERTGARLLIIRDKNIQLRSPRIRSARGVHFRIV